MLEKQASEVDLICIVYVSKANEYLNIGRLERLAVVSAGKNRDAGITGYLYHEDGAYFQYLEGSQEAVSLLMARISRDDRHEVLMKTESSPIRARRFPTWHMVAFRDEVFLKYGVADLIDGHRRLIELVADENVQTADWFKRTWFVIDRMHNVVDRVDNPYTSPAIS